MGAVGLFELGDLLRGELDFDDGGCVVDVGGLGGADDGGGDTGFVQQPGQGNLRWEEAAFGGDLGEPVDDVEVGSV